MALIRDPHGSFNVAEVEIYTTPFCPYCYRAKSVLDKKNVQYREIDVMMAPTKRSEMRERSGGVNTVPQIFVDGTHIGGSDQLLELERDGDLDSLLGIAD
jgi:glutaredoxin 3